MKLIITPKVLFVLLLVFFFILQRGYNGIFMMIHEGIFLVNFLKSLNRWVLCCFWNPFFFVVSLLSIFSNVYTPLLYLRVRGFATLNLKICKNQESSLACMLFVCIFLNAMKMNTLAARWKTTESKYGPPLLLDLFYFKNYFHSFY